MNELSRNGSGYYDVTAYKAMINYQREEENKMECNRGEIWEVNVKTGTRIALIVQVFEQDGYVSALLLRDVSGDCQYPISVRARSIMYGDAGRLQYIFGASVLSYVRTLSEEEWADVMDTISRAYGMTDTVQEAIATIPAPAARAENDLQTATQIAALERENEIYKKLYEDLLNRITA